MLPSPPPRDSELRMANRNNHYEAAFEAYLRDRRVPYMCP